MKIRLMEPDDWPQVSRILQEGIATGIATFQTEVPGSAQWDATYVSTCRLVAESEEGELLGWAALAPVSNRVAYRGVAEVSIYVGTAHRGKTVGTQLLEALVSESERAGFWTLQAVVLTMNTASLSLHLRCGFRLVGRRERIGRLPDGTWSDTILLERRSNAVNPG